MALVFVLVGLPASGKSTFSNSNHDNCIVLSSDAIREELFGAEEVQGDPKQVFSLLRERLAVAIDEGHDVIVDATNMSRWERASYIDIAKEHDATPVAVLFTTPVEVCKQRNAQRTRVVPEFVYDRMLSRYEKPTLEEGFAQILEVVN